MVRTKTSFAAFLLVAVLFWLPASGYGQEPVPNGNNPVIPENEVQNPQDQNFSILTQGDKYAVFAKNLNPEEVALFQYIAGIKDNATTVQLLYFAKLLEEIKIHYVDPKSSLELITLGMKGMVGGLDPNSGLFVNDDARVIKEWLRGESAYQGGVGVSIISLDRNIFIAEVFEDMPAFKAGLEPGDMITKVDGKSIFGLTTNAATNLIKGPDGTAVVLEIKSPRFQKPKLVSLIRQRITVQSVSYKNLKNNIAHIKVRQFSEETPDRFFEALSWSQGKKGLVIDLRGNPGGRIDVVARMLCYLLGRGREVAILKERGTENPYILTSAYGDAKIRNMNITLPVDFPSKMVVLIDNFSASASEMMAGDLQYYKLASVVGVRSFGKATAQQYLGISLDMDNHSIEDGEMVLGITTGRYYLPGGQNVSSDGIVPDVEVEQPDNFRLYERGTKRDAQLQAAIKILEKK